MTEYQEELLEISYWKFDQYCKSQEINGYSLSQRDSYKMAVRWLLSQLDKNEQT
jgi:hypothetical protein